MSVRGPLLVSLQQPLPPPVGITAVLTSPRAGRHAAKRVLSTASTASLDSATPTPTGPSSGVSSAAASNSNSPRDRNKSDSPNDKAHTARTIADTPTASTLSSPNRPGLHRLPSTSRTAATSTASPYSRSRKPSIQAPQPVGGLLASLSSSSSSSATQSPALHAATPRKRASGHGNGTNTLAPAPADNTLRSPPLMARKPSVSRPRPHFAQIGPGLAPSDSSTGLSLSPNRTRLGRDGQPLRSRRTVPNIGSGNGSALDNYIASARGQLGLVQPRPRNIRQHNGGGNIVPAEGAGVGVGARFDPLEDDEEDFASNALPTSPAAGVGSATSPASGGGGGSRKGRRGKNGDKPANSSNGSSSEVHIAAGIVLPSLSMVAPSSLASGQAALRHARKPAMAEVKESSSSSGSGSSGSSNSSSTRGSTITSPKGSPKLGPTKKRDSVSSSKVHPVESPSPPVLAITPLALPASSASEVTPSPIAVSSPADSGAKVVDDKPLTHAASSTPSDAVVSSPTMTSEVPPTFKRRSTHGADGSLLSPSRTRRSMESSPPLDPTFSALAVGSTESVPILTTRDEARQTAQSYMSKRASLAAGGVAMALAGVGAGGNPFDSHSSPLSSTAPHSINHTTTASTNSPVLSSFNATLSSPARGRIERKTSNINSPSSSSMSMPNGSPPGGSPLLGPGSPALTPRASGDLLPPASATSGANGAVGDGFQSSLHSAPLSPESVQDRWRRNLMKRMSVNISFAPSPFSGLLGSVSNEMNRSTAPQPSSPGSGSGSSSSSGTHRGRAGSFSKEFSPNEKGMISVRGLGESNGVSSPRALNRTVNDVKNEENGVGGGGGSHTPPPSSNTHRRGHSRHASLNMSASSSSKGASHSSRASVTLTRHHGQSQSQHAAHAHVALPPPLAVQQQNSASDDAGSAQPYPQNPSFSFLFPHQELLAQQREHYGGCNLKLGEYLGWNGEREDPVIVPARSHLHYASFEPHLALHGSTMSGTNMPLASFPLPLSLPSAFDKLFWDCYTTLHCWESFDVFHFSEVTLGWPLSFMFVVVLKKEGIFEKLGLDAKVAFRFIQEVESHYLPNPYHTSIHAADVLHAVYHFLNDSILRDQISAVDKFLLYVSCAIHDFAHPGVNNGFLVASKAPLAIRYNDRQVLEQFHVSSSFRMMQLTSGCNILEAWRDGKDTKVYSRCRKFVVDMVLATDLSSHFDLVALMKGRFESMMNNATYPPKDGVAAVSGADDSAPGSGVHTPPSTSRNGASPSPSGSPSSRLPLLSRASPDPVPDLHLKTDDDISLVLCCLLKLGDLSHPSRPKNLHLRWAELVTEEFFSQGDRERSLNLTPSMFMDRANTNVATSQLGFLSFLVLPLFQCASKLQANSYWVRKVEKNLELWGELEKLEKREQQLKEAEERAAAGLSPTYDSSPDSGDNSLVGVGSLADLAAAAEKLGGQLSASTTPTLSPQGDGNSSADNSIDSSLLPPQLQQHHHHHGSSSTSTNSAASSGSGSITGRFSTFCKDRTVLSSVIAIMFSKVHSISQSRPDDEPQQHEHAHYLSPDGDARPQSASVNNSFSPGDDGDSSMPQGIAEEPTEARHYNDGSMPGSPLASLRGPAMISVTDASPPKQQSTSKPKP